jgi:hypothetical protein
MESRSSHSRSLLKRFQTPFTDFSKHVWHVYFVSVLSNKTPLPHILECNSKDGRHKPPWLQSNHHIIRISISTEDGTQLLTKYKHSFLQTLVGGVGWGGSSVLGGCGDIRLHDSVNGSNAHYKVFSQKQRDVKLTHLKAALCFSWQMYHCKTTKDISQSILISHACVHRHITPTHFSVIPTAHCSIPSNHDVTVRVEMHDFWLPFQCKW